MELFDKKAEMLTYINELDIQPALFIDLLNNKGYHKFTYFDTHTKLFKNIEELKINNKYHVNEIILNNHKRKPYLDLEQIYPNEKIFNEKFKLMITKLQVDIIKIFKKEYCEKITTDDILLLNSSGQVEGGYKIENIKTTRLFLYLH